MPARGGGGGGENGGGDTQNPPPGCSGCQSNRAGFDH